MRAHLWHFLGASLQECAWFIDYFDPAVGRWQNAESLGGSTNFSHPPLTAPEAAALAAGAGSDGYRACYAEPPWWVAFLTSPRDLLTELVLAGWVPTQAGIDLAVAARRVLDARDSSGAPAETT